MKLTFYRTRLILCFSVLAAIVIEILFVRPSLSSGHLVAAEEALVLASAPIAVALYASVILLRHESGSRRERLEKED